jgi:hypothetical protein
MPGVNAPVGSTRPSLFDAEGGEHARDDDPYERVRHPAAGTDTPAEAECVVDCCVQVWVYVRPDEALWLECEGIGEEPIVVQDPPAMQKQSATPSANGRR